VGMVQPFILPGRPRKRGNPDWGRSGPPPPVIATEFEMQVRQLGLSRQTYADSTELRRWCERNDRCYVPEWLLDVWGIEVILNFDWPATRPWRHSKIQ
jgi:hypothetical protein